MHKVVVLSVLVLIGTNLANAGQIQLGSGVNGASGLSATYVTGGTAQTGWGEFNYDVRLFQNVTQGGLSLTPTLTGNAYTKTGGQAVATLSDTGAGAETNSATGVTFNMISDGTNASGNSNNFWEGFGANTLTVPVGIYDVTDVWTLINNVWGSPNAVDTTVTFNFGNSANGATTKALTVQLTNAGSVVNGTPSGQISASVNCTTVAATCNNYAIGPTAASSSIATSGTGSVLLPNITVLTDQVLSTAYNGGGTGTTYAGSAGNAVMTDQGFEFGSSFTGLYLVNIQIAEATGGGSNSQTGLSAITLDATPEPSTIWLLVAGFATAGFSRLRKKN
jgi:hypothetical protein